MLLLQNGNTALHEASRNGYADVVQVLLKANCFVDGYNSLGMTPLHIACQQGHVSVVKVLLKHKSNSLLANKVTSCLWMIATMLFCVVS